VAWLIKEYVDYLIGGGSPVAPPVREPSSEELALVAQSGRAFDWLAEEPELYSADDGEPV
jgi:hypothetical protein